MPEPTAPARRRVKLKRVTALKRGDLIVPGLGLFTRVGERLDTADYDMRASWGRGSWFVVGDPWMNAALEMNVPLSPTATHGPASDVLHTMLDAYVVLALEGN